MGECEKPWDALVRRIPSFIQRTLVLGPHAEHVAAILHTRGLTDVYAFREPESPWPFPDGWFDAIIETDESDNGAAVVQSALPLLSSWGYVLIVAPDRGLSPASLCPWLSEISVAFYGYLATKSDPVTESVPENYFLLLAVRPDYNPVLHARNLFEKLRPQRALDVLLTIPSPYLENAEVDALVVSEILLCMLALDERNPGERLDRFIQAQKMFYMAIARKPEFHPLYQYQAEWWRRLGDVGMARRMLQSILYVAPNENVQRQLDSFPIPVVQEGPVTTPQIEIPERRPRMLFITHPRPHYGLDVIYDGLCQVLGDENVVEYPYKPLLHGSAPERLKNYPCCCNHAGSELRFEEIICGLRANRFDVILYGELENDLDHEEMRAIVHAAPQCPVYLVDQQDECDLSLKRMIEWLNLNSVAGIFKREMLQCHNYGETVYPLPFAYPDHRLPQDIDSIRTRNIFWAGHRQFGLRRLYLERIEKKFQCQLNETLEQEAYKAAMLQSKIGINIFGLGYDTVRYWELPAHGCLLLSERPPIKIPNNFVDGKSAVFFDSLPDLEEKLDYYLAHPGESHRIARAGHDHLCKYHTAAHRARQLLRYILKFDLSHDHPR